MDSRLLTTEQKAANKRSRNQRKNKRRQEKNREQFMSELFLETGCGGVSLLASDILASEEIVKLFDPDLRNSWRTAETFRKSLDQLSWVPAQLDPERTASAPKVPRPSRLLSKQCSGAPLAIHPFQGPPLPVPPYYIGVNPAVEYAQQAAKLGACRLRLLEFLNNVADLSIPDAASWLSGADDDSLRYTQSEIELMESWSHFRRFYEEGRQRYGAFVESERIELRFGDWGYFSLEQLEQLIPRVHAPLRFRRNTYLVNQHRNEAGQVDGLDIYSSEYHPLFTIRVPPGSNPEEWRDSTSLDCLALPEGLSAIPECVEKARHPEKWQELTLEELSPCWELLTTEQRRRIMWNNGIRCGLDETDPTWNGPRSEQKEKPDTWWTSWDDTDLDDPLFQS